MPKTAVQTKTLWLLVRIVATRGTKLPNKITPSQNISCVRTVKEALRAHSCRFHIGGQRYMQEGKDRQKLGDFNPNRSCAAPLNAVCLNLTEYHEKLNCADGTGHAGDNPKNRNNG